MTHRSSAGPHKTNAPICIFLFTLTCAMLAATPATAETFCELVPAAAVKAALGITENLTAKPSDAAGTGCLYREDAPGPVTLIASSGNASGMMGTLFSQRMNSLSHNAQALPDVGEAAYYDETGNQQFAKFPGTTYTQQSIVFRAKGKIISLRVMTSGGGVTKTAVQSLATLTLSKPIETLEDPNN
jgi:hypothetical protein